MTDKQPVAAIYCRVSTDEQADNNSLPSQEASCREYAVKHGYLVDESHVYQETLSGLQYRNRPKLLAAMQAIKNGDVDVIVAHDDDRLSREPGHRLHLHDEAKYYGGKILYVLREVDDTPEAELINYVRGMGSRQEVAQFKERSKRGKNARLTSGKLWGTGVAAFGYRWGHKAEYDPDEPTRKNSANRKTHYEIDPITAPIVQRMFQLAVGGASLRRIAAWLASEGIVSPRGRQLWSMNTVRDILHNPVYKGQARFGRTSYRKVYDRNKDAEKTITIEHPEDQHTVLQDGLIPRLVSDKDWDAVQVRLAQNKAEACRPPANPEMFLLRGGFVRCGYCGASVSARSPQPGPYGRVPLYQMARASSHRECGHVYSISAKALDESVWGMVKEMFADPVVLSEKILETVSGPDPTADERASIKAELAEIEQEQATLALNMGRVTAASAVTALANRLEALGQRHDARSERHAALLDEYAQWRAAQEQARSLSEWWTRTAEGLDGLDYNGKRDQMRRMNVVVKLWEKDHEPRWEMRATVTLGGHEFSSTFRPLAAPPKFANPASWDRIKLGGQGGHDDDPDGWWDGTWGDAESDGAAISKGTQAASGADSRITDHFSTRWYPRAERCNCRIAARISPSPAASSAQWARTCAGLISALVTVGVPANRAACTARAASTRARTAADGSPARSSDSFSYGTRGTSKWISIRSSRGPERRLL